MPRSLELGLNRIFRSRWGVALVLGAIILAVVGIGRLFADGAPSAPALNNTSPAPAVSVDPAEDDSVIDSAPPPSPSTSPGRAQPEAVAYAFASAWVDHQNVSSKTWQNRLLPNITKDLAEELNGVDPAGVPADRVIGRPSLVPVSATVVNAVVTMNSGKLNLRLTSPGRALAGGRHRLGLGVTLPRPRRVVLLVALVATLALLCCGGGAVVLLLGGLTDDNSKLNTAFGCGKGGAVDPDSKLPRIRSYGAAQIRNAAIIINVGSDLKMPPRAWVIAVATAMQESRLTNLGNLGSRNDHDSLGLFQQRPSSGWGSRRR